MRSKFSKSELERIDDALYLGATRKIEKYLHEGWDPTVPMWGGNPLSTVRNPKMAALLIEKGVNVNEPFNGVSPLIHRSGSGPEHMVRFLLHAGADVNAQFQRKDDPDHPPGTTALIQAIAHNKPEIVRLLLEARADLKLCDADSHNALWHAAFWNRTAIIKELVQRGAPLNDDVLFGPVRAGNAETVELLLSKGANPNCRLRPCLPGFMKGDTLLGKAITSIEHREVRIGKKIGVIDYPSSIALALIKAGADPNQIWINRPPINLAAFTGHLEILKALLRAGAEVDARDTTGNTALADACVKGHIEIVKVLIEAGADVNIVGRDRKTPLQFAQEGGHQEVVKILKASSKLSHIGRTGGPAPEPEPSALLIRAAKEGNLGKIKDLLRGGTDINLKDANGFTALMHAAANNHSAVVTELVKRGANIEAINESGETPLLLGTESGATEAVRVLLEHGSTFSIVADRHAPLHLAAMHGWNEIAKELLAAGADPNQNNAVRETPLMWAVWSGELEIAKALLQAGTKLEAKDKEGQTPLFWALNGCANSLVVTTKDDLRNNAALEIEELAKAEQKAFRCVQWLVEVGASVNARDKQGWTPLMVAATEETVELLLASGADPTLKNKEGKTALSLAKERRFKWLVPLLSGASRIGGTRRHKK